MPFGPTQLTELDCDLASLRKIPGFPGYYINEDGQVFAVRMLRTHRDDDGYLRVSTKRLKKAVHWLLARVFLPPPRPGQNEVRHLDGNPRNIRIDNLAWGTRAENAADMARHGSAKGSNNGNSVLTETNVIEIMNLAPMNTAVSISELIGKPVSAVKAVLSGQNWSHVTGITRKVRQ